MPQTVVEPSKNYSTHDFDLKKNIMREWEELNKWIEVRRLQDLPPKFEKGVIFTLRGICKVKDSEKCLGC